MSDYKKYLPSKLFITRVLFVLVLIILFFAVRSIISFFKNRDAKKNTPVQMTVGTLIQKDSNENGIPDWEEYLWGLDPYKNGQGNKDLINAKKNTLLKNGEIQPMDDSKELSDNEMLSRQFFATIMSLQQTGELNEESVNSVSGSIGENVKIIEINDIYQSNMLSIKADSPEAKETYREDLAKLVTKYTDADIGNELTFIVQGLSNKDPQALYVADTVATSYQSFGKDLMKMSVPKALVSIHLSIANNYEKNGQSIKALTKVISDPIIGMSAILTYKKYNDALGVDLEKISEILQ